MRDLINTKYKHLLWKDENDSTFLLLKNAEIYRFGENLYYSLKKKYNL